MNGRYFNTIVRGKKYRRRIVSLKDVPENIRLFQNEDHFLADRYVGSYIDGNTCFDVYDLPLVEVNLFLPRNSGIKEEEEAEQQFIYSDIDEEEEGVH